jgi:hypothetical protein
MLPWQFPQCNLYLQDKHQLWVRQGAGVLTLSAASAVAWKLLTCISVACCLLHTAAAAAAAAARARPEVMTVGLKAVRELSLRCPLVMSEELLQVGG